MNAYILVPTLALFINIVVWSYVFGQRQKDALNRAFLFLAADVAGWLLIDFMYQIPATHGYEICLLKIASVFWIPLGVLFLNFAYVLSGQKKDWIFYSGVAHAVLGIVLNLSTDLFILGVERHPWGINQISHPLRHTLLVAGMVVVAMRGLLLIFRKWVSSTDLDERRVSGMILIGGAAAMISSLTLNVIIPNFFPYFVVPQFGNAAIEFFVITVFLAVSKYRFLSISVDRVAEELFEDVQEGILLLDRSNRIKRANRRARRLLGEDLAGRNVLEFFSEADLTGTYRRREVEVDGPGGNHILLLSSPVSGRRGSRIGRVILIRDITAQKRAEAVLRKSRDELEAEVKQWTGQLRQAQKMEALGTVAGSIAHDFNNLLAAILGFTHAARNDLPLTHPVHEDLGEVLAAGARAKEIIRQVLAFSRKESRSEYDLMNIEEVLQEAIDLLRVSFPTTINIVTESRLKKTTVRCDPAEIIQVMMNLGTNAFQAMGGQTSGELRFSIRNVTVDTAGPLPPLKPGEYVVILVEDSGIGMDEATLSRIFDPFFTTKPAGEGTGLGLSTALGIITSHGGTISVKSTPKEGSAFSVFLPALDETPAERARTSDPATPGSERVLVVDDEQQMRKVVRRMLEPLGYRVTDVSDGLEALSLFQAGPEEYDVVITDFTMPYMTGGDLARRVREIRADIPIILISGYLEDVSTESLLKDGITLFLKKPFTQSGLSAQIRTVLDGY